MNTTNTQTKAADTKVPANPSTRLSPEIELNFPKFENEDKMTESEICLACTGCCRYVTVPIEFPRAKAKLDEYVWYLLHRNVEIYIDHDNDWNVMFKTPCDKLLDNGMCSIYETRPQICRDYSAKSCSRTGKDHKFLFKRPQELLDYLAERKKSKTKGKTAALRKSSVADSIQNVSKDLTGDAIRTSVKSKRSRVSNKKSK